MFMRHSILCLTISIFTTTSAMKKILLFTIITTISQYTCYSQDLKNPVEYLSYIGEEYSKIAKDQWSYTRAVGHGKGARKVEKRRLEVAQAIGEAKRRISRMPALNGSTSFRDSVMTYMNISYHLIKEDYAKIVDMEEVAEESYDQMEAYILAKKRATEKSSKAYEIVRKEQDIFARENNINMVESTSKIGQRLKKSSQVFDYYNKVYLIFFKSYKQDLYLHEALNRQDVNAIEQNRSALKKYSSEGREKLKLLTNFNGDQSLYISARQMLQFYSDQAENKTSIQVEYLIKKDQFDKIKSAFDKIKSSKKTQADIDKYNTAIDDLNLASNAYNKVGKQLHEENVKRLANWNKKSNEFLDRHIP